MNEADVGADFIWTAIVRSFQITRFFSEAVTQPTQSDMNKISASFHFSSRTLLGSRRTRRAARLVYLSAGSFPQMFADASCRFSCEGMMRFAFRFRARFACLLK